MRTSASKWRILLRLLASLRGEIAGQLKDPLAVFGQVVLEWVGIDEHLNQASAGHYGGLSSPDGGDNHWRRLITTG